jgi:hypothetical protein
MADTTIIKRLGLSKFAELIVSKNTHNLSKKIKINLKIYINFRTCKIRNWIINSFNRIFLVLF